MKCMNTKHMSMQNVNCKFVNQCHITNKLFVVVAPCPLSTHNNIAFKSLRCGINVCMFQPNDQSNM